MTPQWCGERARLTEERTHLTSCVLSQAAQVSHLVVERIPLHIPQVESYLEYIICLVHITILYSSVIVINNNIITII